ncbi:MAG TPA: phosphoenolpyruvate carboxykinase (GTP) [Caldilineae bacterium]|nr:phosphoenolpyruvate carboxykinase (GTP) [Caldilineae bacterium]HIQ11593.1 phosphoenolpyruvate carboxykinase (GTP) [Caldilineales bacterium]
MLELRKGVDILTEIGGIKSLEQAQALFDARLDAANRAKLARIHNEEALLTVANAISMCNPDHVFIHSGSPEDMQWVRALALERKEEAPLAMPEHTIHFDLPQEQARIVDRTFYIVNPGEDVSVLALKIERDEAFEYVREYMTNIMQGMTMMVGFYSRGPVGAKASAPAVEISSSAYVMHSADILYRHVYERFDEEAERVGYIFKNVHSQGPNRPEDLPKARVFMDRSWLTTFSMFCTYAGNTLLLKKGNHRFAVDMATYFKIGKELSEHMFITGMIGPGGRKTIFAGAAPSGCGKTTTAMAGDAFIGDDLAQMWIEEKDGTLRAVNPERGIFGIIKDVNWDSDPHLMNALRNPGAEVIWSNVLIHDGAPYWEGCCDDPPEKGINFQGEWWRGKTDEQGNPIPMSHPNARVTVPCEAIENYDLTLAESPEGAPVKVITYSGRDADTMPPVWVARDPDEGVAIGASIVSAATATEIGVSGVRRQPWANSPFIPGPLGDYMRAQFEFFNSPLFTDETRPIMAGLNYFLTHEARGGEGKGLLGEKRDVRVWLSWLERRAHGDVDAIETPIGYIPRYEDLKQLFTEIIDKDYPRELYDRQFALYINNLVARLDLQEEAYRKEESVPEKIFQVYARQREDLLALKAKYGSIVTPEQLEEANNG